MSHLIFLKNVSLSAADFSFDPSLDLLVDPPLQAIDTIFFNAALLERSIGLKTSDYFAIARPSVENITE